MVNLGLHKISLEEFKQIIASKDRGKAGFSAPAHGLYLTKIEYSNDDTFNELNNDTLSLTINVELKLDDPETIKLLPK